MLKVASAAVYAFSSNVRASEMALHLQSVRVNVSKMCNISSAPAQAGPSKQYVLYFLALCKCSGKAPDVRMKSVLMLVVYINISVASYW